MTHFDYGAITLWGFAFQQILLYACFLTFRLTSILTLQPLYMPRVFRLTTAHTRRIQVWAVPLSLAATSGIYNCSLFLRVLRCFTSPGSLSTAWSTEYSNSVSFLIRKSSDQRLLHTSPKLIAATPRPSSPLTVKASTICSWVPLGTQKTITATFISFERFYKRSRVFCVITNIPTDEKTSLRIS